MSISVVIPCRNEARFIEQCLRSVLAQVQPPGGFEIIVVDGMSEDGTRSILQEVARQSPQVRLLENPLRTTPCAMNIGIRAAKGDWICIMGAHQRYAPDYLVECLKVASETGADNVGGSMFCETSTYVQRAIAAGHHSPFAVGGALWHDPTYEGWVDTVFGGFYAKDVFARIGLFDEELTRNQDDELNLRIVRSNGRIWQSPRIRSWYAPRSSLTALFKQYFQYGYWKVLVIRKHHLPASFRHVVPPAFVLGIATGWIPGVFSSSFLLLYVTVLAAYLFLALIFSLREANSAGRDLLPILPLVFAIYHVAYGMGFLLGIFDFVIYSRKGRSAMQVINR